jgi:hypothetical protein
MFNVTGKNMSEGKKTPDYQNWEKTLPSWRYQSNSFAILDVLFQTVNYKFKEHFARGSYTDEIGTYRLSNGSEVTLGNF